MHDWSCDVTEIEGFGAFIDRVFNQGNKPESPVKNVTLTIPVKSIESGKRKMNDIMYEALKAEEYPTIEYELTSSEIIDESGDRFTLQTEGLLTVAGVTRQVNLQAKGEHANGRSLRFTGNKSLNMSDFNVEPPKALFGAIKAGDQVQVHFDATFE